MANYFVEVVRTDPFQGVYARGLIIGPLLEKTEAEAELTRLQKESDNPQSSYAVVECEWATGIRKQVGRNADGSFIYAPLECIQWYTSEEEAKFLTRQFGGDSPYDEVRAVHCKDLKDWPSK